MASDSAILQALLRSAAYLDIETLGLNTGVPIHELSVFDASTGRAYEYIPTPSKLVGAGSYTGADPLLKTPRKLVNIGSWAEAVSDTLSVGNDWLAKRLGIYPHLNNPPGLPGIVQNSFRRESIGANKVITQTGMGIGEAINSVFNRLSDRTVFIANAPFECLSGDTMVQLRNGTFKEIIEINNDTEILGTAPIDLPYRESEFVIAKPVISKGFKNCYEIRSRFGLPTISSEKHLWFTQRGWIFTKDLTEKDWLLLNNTEIDYPEDNSFSDKELELIGWFIAEGSRISSESPGFKITVAEKEYIDNLPKFDNFEWKTTDGKNWRLSQIIKKYKKKGKKYPSENIGKALIERVGLDNKYSYEKYIPDCILRLSNRQLAIVLRCMISGDGHISNRSVIYTTTSRKLAHQLVLIYQRFGIWSSLVEVEDNRKESYKLCYRVIVSSEALEIFNKKIGLSLRKGRELSIEIDCIKNTQKFIESRRIPIELTKNWKDKWKNFVLNNFKVRTYGGKLPLKKMLREFTKTNTDGICDGNSDTWGFKTLKALESILNVKLSNTLLWVPISKITCVGEQEVFDIETSTHEYIANGFVTHNSKQLGAYTSALGITDQLRSKVAWVPEKLDELLYVNNPAVLSARSTALATGDWRGVVEEMERVATNRSGIKVFDVFDIIRGAQSYGNEVSKQYGLRFNLGDLSTGVGIDVQARIMGIGPELHRATEDNVLTALIGQRSAEHIGTFRSMLDRAKTGTGAALMASNPQEVDAMNWLYRMSLLKSESSAIYMRSTIARAMQDIEQGKPHQMKVGYQDVRMPQVDMGRRYKTLVPIPIREEFSNMDDVITHLGQQTRSSGLDIQAIYNEVRSSATSKGKIDPVELSNIAQSSESSIDKLLDKIAGKEFDLSSIKPTSVKPLKTMNFLKNAKTAGVVAGVFGLSAIAYGALSGFFGTFNEPNQSTEFDGLQDQGIGARNRSTNSDFGSPYKGLWNSLSYQLLNSPFYSDPLYANSVPIDDEIAEFRLRQYQTPLQKRIIDNEMAQQEIQSIDRLYFLDPKLTTPLANQGKGLQELDITNMKWSVEDADTLILQSGIRGLLGQQTDIRLAGIDAPEVMHNDESISRLRYKQGQPGGEEARNRLQQILANAKNVKLQVSPTQATYGRSLGVIFADGVNVNEQLVKEGMVAALPFGDVSQDLINRSKIRQAEEAAFQNKLGMWSTNYWRTYHSAVPISNRITFNTLSRLDKLAGNMNYAQLQATMEKAEQGPNSELLRNSIGILKHKFSKKYKEDLKPEQFVAVNYNNNNMEYMDQLKFETSRHMTHYGNQMADTNMSVKGHQFGNSEFAIDSLSRSSTIYQSRLPGILNRYLDKIEKRKLQGKMQRMGNQVMKFENNGHTRM